MQIEIKYRTHLKSIAPRKIKLEIPGWAGTSKDHGDGGVAQPWHCPPFVDACCGLELLYHFDNECYVTNTDGKINFEGFFKTETVNNETPFGIFAPGHYGFSSWLDIQVPEGYVLRLESHPKYYTDLTFTTPCVVPGHLQTSWWPRVFFVVFKIPAPGQVHVFRKDEPYAQILVLPNKVNYKLTPMTPDEAASRCHYDNIIDKTPIGKNKWLDVDGNSFDDKYKVLSKYGKEGSAYVHHHLEDTRKILLEDKDEKINAAARRMKRRIVHINETLQDLSQEDN